MNSLAHELVANLMASRQTDIFGRLARESVKFVYDQNGISPDVQKGAGKFALDLFINRIFPLPYENVLFEVVLSGADFGCRHFVNCFSINGEVWAYGAMMVDGQILVYPACYHINVNEDGSAPISTTPDPLVYQQYCDGLIRKGISKEEAQERAEELCEHGRKSVFRIAMEVIGLLACRSGVSTEVSRAPKFINAQRARKGKVPIFEHRVLRIDVATAPALPGVRRDGMTHASPAMHWRRGHIRKLASGAHTMVRPCIVGDPSYGLVTKDYAVAPALARAVPA